MASFECAEDVSRFLRSKNAPEAVLAVAKDLVNGDISVYFPQKDLFVLELICDRLNANTGQWRVRSDVWLLLQRLWTSVDLRLQNVFKRIRLVDILIDILQSCAANNNTNTIDTATLQALIGPVFDFVDVLVKNVFIEMDESVLLRLLAAYVPFAGSQVYEPRFANTVHQLFNIVLSTADYVPSKKSVTRFVQELLCGVCEYMASHPEDTDTNALFSSVVDNFSLSENTIQQTLTELEKPSNKHSKRSGKALVYFFDLMVSKLSDRDFKTLEVAYNAIVSTHSDIAEELLAILANKNKSLSSEFIGEIYNKNIAMDTKNWSLVIYLIEIDNELAVNNAEHLLMLFEAVKDDAIVTRFRNAFIGSFVKARELPAFYNDIWFGHRDKQSWRTTSFVDLVAGYADDLTLNQARDILNHCFEQDDVQSTLPLIASIIGGLLSGTTSAKIHGLQSLLVENGVVFQLQLKCLSEQDIQTLWQTIYGILCLYSEESLESIKQALADLLKSIPSNIPFYYFTLFRAIELFENIIDFDYEKPFLKFLSSSSCDNQLYQTLLARWLVIINFSFTPDYIKKILDIITRKLPLATFIQVITENSGVIFELKNISDALVKFTLDKLNAAESSSDFIELLAIIPLECIDSRDYPKLVDHLQQLSGTEKLSSASCTQLDRFLLNPKLNLEFERSLQKMTQFLGNGNSHTQDIALGIVRRIWKAYVSRYSEFESFVDSSLKSLTSTMKSSLPHLQLTLVFISLKDTASDSDLQHLLNQLENKYVLFIEGQMVQIAKSKKVKDLPTLNWLLKSLLEVNHSEPENIRKAVVQLGGVFSSKNDAIYDDIKVVLFELISHWAHSQVQDATYIAALYIALKSSRNLDIQNPLQEYLTRFSSQSEREHFEQFAYYASDSLLISNAEQLPQLISLVSLLILTLKQKDDISQEVFVTIMSNIITVTDKLDTSCLLLLLGTLRTQLSECIWLFKQYATESTLLLVSKIAHLLNKKAADSADSELYILVSQVFSYLLLFHRYKFQSRHHILIRTMTDLLEPLAFKKHNRVIATSPECATAYARLVGNLCEPPATNSYKDIANSSLTTSTTIIKKGLRKYLPMLLVSYISFSLKYNFDSTVNDELVRAMYTVFDVLTERELQLVNSTLDFPGKSFYRSLYATYKDQGKWKDN